MASNGVQGSPNGAQSRKKRCPKNDIKIEAKKEGKMMPKGSKIMPKLMPKSLIFHTVSKKAELLETICFTI